MIANPKVALEFLRRIRYFKDCLKQHGQSAEGNPSAGNNYRGLYNIALKSLGAAMKKSPDVRLDGVMQYSEPYQGDRGFYFMDSPGNDIESVAGQVCLSQMRMQMLNLEYKES